MVSKRNAGTGKTKEMHVISYTASRNSDGSVRAPSAQLGEWKSRDVSMSHTTKHPALALFLVGICAAAVAGLAIYMLAVSP